MEFEQELFKQRKRLADAERILETKTTKAATHSMRIATSKIDLILGRLADLRRSEPLEPGSRIFPGQYAPVMVMEEGQLVVKPMRYQCVLRECRRSTTRSFPGRTSSSTLRAIHRRPRHPLRRRAVGCATAED